MRRLDRVSKRIQSTNASECAPNLDSVDTPARDDSYADSTRAQFLQPVLRNAPHDKLTSNGIHCNGLRAFATRFSVCLSPASNGSIFTPVGTGFRMRKRAQLTPKRHNRRRVHCAKISAARPIPRADRQRLRRACDTESNVRSSTVGRLRTSDRGNAKSRTG